jgi:hypothetical protein
MRKFCVAVLVLALGGVTAALEAPAVVPSQPEAQVAGVLRFIGRAIGVGRRQERRQSRQARRGNAC